MECPTVELNAVNNFASRSRFMAEKTVSLGRSKFVK
jgi:hypothetical protein